MSDSEPAAVPPPGGTSADPVGDQIFGALPDALRRQISGRCAHQGQGGFQVNRDDAYALLEHLRDAHGFDVLIDVTAVDFLDRDAPERFEVVYVLQRRRPEIQYFRVHAWVPEEDPRIRSVYELWRSASWAERECHDMFGIVFDGNPDLRRFLMPEDYPSFPLLKDYPLKGRGERLQFPRVVPRGDEMREEPLKPYPVSIGREMHTPEYLEEIKRDSKPKS